MLVSYSLHLNQIGLHGANSPKIIFIGLQMCRLPISLHVNQIGLHKASSPKMIFANLQMCWFPPCIRYQPCQLISPLAKSPTRRTPSAEDEGPVNVIRLHRRRWGSNNRHWVSRPVQKTSRNKMAMKIHVHPWHSCMGAPFRTISNG